MKSIWLVPWIPGGFQMDYTANYINEIVTKVTSGLEGIFTSAPESLLACHK
jgi:hypothetical protein